MGFLLYVSLVENSRGSGDGFTKNVDKSWNEQEELNMHSFYSSLQNVEGCKKHMNLKAEELPHYLFPNFFKNNEVES